MKYLIEIIKNNPFISTGIAFAVLFLVGFVIHGGLPEPSLMIVGGLGGLFTVWAAIDHSNG